MSFPTHRLRRLFVRAWPLLAAVAVLIGLPLLLSTNRHGRVAVAAALYLPDMIVVLPLPVRPVDLISQAPSRERVTIDYQSRNGPRSIDADLYIPADGKQHSGVVFSMGAPPLRLDDPRLVRIAEDASRAGVVMLVPFSDRLDDLQIAPEEIDALVAEFQYVQQLPQVDPKRVGFFGASVGGSIALVAAADPRIADDVDHVVSFGGYFDALSTFGAVATQHIEYESVDEAWVPRIHAEHVVASQLIDYLADPHDRELLTRMFVDDEPATPAEIATFGAVARNSYNFLANRDPNAVDGLITKLPPDAVAQLRYLSPETSIANVKAELFIIHDRADPFVPYTESRRLKDAVGNRPRTHFDELRLFEHVEPKLNQDPDIIAIDSTRLLFRMYQLLLRWD